MRVLLINSPAKEHPVVRDMAGGLGFDGGEAIVLPPLDLAYMAATLLNKGNEVKIIDSDVENYLRADVYQIIQNYKPEVIIATVSLPTLYEDCSFLKRIRECSSGKIIAKTNITYPPILKEILEKSSVDLCIYGECDINIDEIIAEREKKGTAYFKDSELKTEENMVIADLDELPLPARNLLPNEKYQYVLLGDEVTTMQTSRGCPYPCSYYCPYPLVQGKIWRARSPEHVIREIEDIVNNYGIQKILFRDATFTFDKERAKQICELILEKKIKISWWCETRINCIDEDLLKVMRAAGCMGMNIGVETGDPKVLESQAKIGTTLEALEKVRSFSKGLGIKLHFLLMIGLPSETKASLYQTHKLVQKLAPESIGITFVTPYPGTPLYYEAKEKGWIETEEWTKFGGHLPVMHTDNLSSQDLLKAQKLLHQGFYLLNEKLLKKWVKSKILEYRFKRWLSH